MALRLFYALGPGDAVHSYRLWKAGAEVLSETARTFSGQFFDYCRRAGHAVYAVSSFGEACKLRDGRFTVENRPKRWPGDGLRYHLSQALYGVSLMASALRWRADAVIVDSGTTHWALLGALRLARIRTVAVIHNALWPAGCRPTGLARRLMLAGDAWFWRRVASAVISVSPACERQVRELAGSLEALAVQFRPMFNRADFAAMPAAPAARAPFRLLYAGRVERNKGVLDLVEMARVLERERPGRVQIDVCGGGAALSELEASIRRTGLEGVVRTHGRLERRALLEFYAACHAVVVPTRSEIGEGLSMVAAEAILCRRPVVTSRLCAAVELLPGAVVMAAPDDPASYAAAVGGMLDDPALYDALCAACGGLQEQFYDPRANLAAAFEAVFGR